MSTLGNKKLDRSMFTSFFLLYKNCLSFLKKDFRYFQRFSSHYFGFSFEFHLKNFHPVCAAGILTLLIVSQVPWPLDLVAQLYL